MMGFPTEELALIKVFYNVIILFIAGSPISAGAMAIRPRPMCPPSKVLGRCALYDASLMAGGGGA
jgi:hypothetical protein